MGCRKTTLRTSSCNLKEIGSFHINWGADPSLAQTTSKWRGEHFGRITTRPSDVSSEFLHDVSFLLHHLFTLSFICAHALSKIETALSHVSYTATLYLCSLPTHESPNQLQRVEGFFVWAFVGESLWNWVRIISENKHVTKSPVRLILCLLFWHCRQSCFKVCASWWEQPKRGWGIYSSAT